MFDVSPSRRITPTLHFSPFVGFFESFASRANRRPRKTRAIITLYAYHVTILSQTGRKSVIYGRFDMIFPFDESL